MKVKLKIFPDNEHRNSNPDCVDCVVLAYKNRHLPQWNRIESTKNKPVHLGYTDFFFFLTLLPRQFSGTKNSLFNRQ